MLNKLTRGYVFKLRRRQKNSLKPAKGPMWMLPTRENTIISLVTKNLSFRQSNLTFKVKFKCEK